MSSQKKPKKGSGKKPAAKKNAQTRLREESIFSHFRREIWGVVCILLAVLVLSRVGDGGVMAPAEAAARIAAALERGHKNS